MNYFLLFLIVCALVFGDRFVKRTLKKDHLGYSKSDYKRFEKQAKNPDAKRIFKRLSE